MRQSTDASSLRRLTAPPKVQALAVTQWNILFTAAKISHLGLLPQGQPERRQRALRMVGAMYELDFGSCTNHGECEAVCPKGISLDFIARLNRDYLRAGLAVAPEPLRNV